ncbi:pilus assembly protein TadG-related protein [Lacipirellula sp.]|uniref:vWA domain-containing protein n=1 Tax=Lacipirellula sp. TaxID=2691419 RepID=UPI003D0B5AC0
MKLEPDIQRTSAPRQPRRVTPPRRGVILVLTGFCLVALFAFVALSVDAGRMVLTSTKMQNAVDASALAAAQEISAAIHAAGQGQGSANVDANSIAVEQARSMAAQVAEANGLYIDPSQDVKFGKRVFDDATGTWPIHWGASPFNVVKVVGRRTDENVDAPDGQLPLAFGWAVGRSKVPITASATAFVEARDLVVVLDFSASMNDDSTLGDSALSQAQVEAQLDAMWAALQAANPKWPNTTVSKFPAAGFGQVKSAAGTSVSSTDVNTIFTTLQLNARNSDGSAKYPFPQSGRASNGKQNAKLSATASDTAWKAYITYTKGLSGTYKQKYGYRTLLSYLQNSKNGWYESEDLWRTPHYPFHAVKQGTSLFFNFLTDLDFGDEVGVVSYGSYAVKEWDHHDGEVDIDISADPITADYATLDNIQRRHQAGHYDDYTGMGDGILKGRELLLGVDSDPNDDGFSRYGARPTMIVMTDGQANRCPANWSLPASFKWKDWTDYDGNGTANYTTTDKYKQYAFYEATKAIDRGATIHTFAVGADADRALMQAIAYAGGGIYMNVPGGSTVAAMENQLTDAYRQIASKVPPAKLVYEFPNN